MPGLSKVKLPLFRIGNGTVINQIHTLSDLNPDMNMFLNNNFIFNFDLEFILLVPNPVFMEERGFGFKTKST